MNDHQLIRPRRLSLDALLEFIEQRGIEVAVAGRGVCATAQVKIPREYDRPGIRELLAENEDGLLQLDCNRRLFELRSKRPPRRWDHDTARNLIDSSLAKIRALYLDLPLETRREAIRTLEGSSIRIEQWVIRRDLLGLSRALTKYETRIAALGHSSRARGVD